MDPKSPASTEHSIKEGLAEIFSIQNNEVFYNPVQCVNRDLSVAMIQTFIDVRLAEKADRLSLILAKREAKVSARFSLPEFFIGFSGSAESGPCCSRFFRFDIPP